MIAAKEFYDSLLAEGFGFFSGVPDSLLQSLCACIEEHTPPEKHIIAANEGNAVALAAGHYLATRRPGVVYLQNSGLGNAVNPLLSLADSNVYGIPLLLVVGWRGQPGHRDEPQHQRQGEATLPLLEAIGVPAYVLEEDYAPQLRTAAAKMYAESRPVALVVKEGSFSAYPTSPPASCYTLAREQALRAVLAALNTEDIVVATTGKTSRELYTLREENAQPRARDFLVVGSMGHAASLALGISLSSKKKVYCLDGDGAFLMHMGGLAVAAQHAPPGFRYILLNNGAHESVGGQPTVALKADAVRILEGCGFAPVFAAETEAEVAAAVQRMHCHEKSALVVFLRQGSRPGLGRPALPPSQSKDIFMDEMEKA